MRVILTSGQELLLLEALIFFLLLIPTLRTFIHDRRILEGLVLAPPLALIANIAIFPAYGFRPECTLLLLCNIWINVLNRRVVRHKSAVFDRASNARVGIDILLVCVTALAVYFLPLNDTRSVGWTTRTFDNQETQEEFNVRLYHGESPAPSSVTYKGIVAIAPPFTGARVIDEVCAALADALAPQGFLVLVMDPPSPTLQEKIAFLHARLWGAVFEKPNKSGREFEEQKKRDMTFLLSHLEGLVHGQDVPVFLLGYDASGSAVYSLATEDEVVEQYHIRGAVAVESRFWSMYYREELPTAIPEGFFKQLIFNIWADLKALLPKRVNRIGITPAPQAAFLFLASDRITAPSSRDRYYAPALKLFHTTSEETTGGRVTLLAREGAGPFDYSDYPETQPLFSALNPGVDHRVNGRTLRKNSVSSTVSILAEFIESVLGGRELRYAGHYRE
jgi:hypothetical protein